MQRRALNEIGNLGEPGELNQRRRSSSLDNFKKVKGQATKANFTVHGTENNNAGPIDKATLQTKTELAPTKRQIATVLPYGVLDLNLMSEAEETGVDIKDYISILRSKEVNDVINPNFLNSLENQTSEITASMRAILIDWIIQVHTYLKFHSESLHITVKLIDKYLAQVPVQVSQVQLVGLVALWDAAKLEEYKTPNVQELVRLSKDTYLKQEVLHGEKHLLHVLKYNLNTTPPTLFLDYFTMCAQSPNTQFHAICSYALDCLLPTMHYVNKKPSLIAASAVLAGILVTTGSLDWDLSLQYYTGYQLQDLVPLVRYTLLMWLDYDNPNFNLKATFKKYKSRKHFNNLSTAPIFESYNLLGLYNLLDCV